MNIQRLIALIILSSFLASCSNSISPSAPLPDPPTTNENTDVPLSKTATSTRRQNTAIRKMEVSRTPNSMPNTASPTITRTSTPQPPLTAHTWEVDQVLVQISRTGGDGCCWYTYPPTLMLYGDGLLIRSKNIGQFGYEMMGRKLERSEVCALLNTLDQVGFLDYDHSKYMDPMDGASSEWIAVNAWKKQLIYGQFLSSWVYKGGDWWQKECDDPSCLPPPVILPALSNAYKLLDQYDPGGLEKITPNKLVLWILPDETEKTPSPWPIKEISLATLSQQAAEENRFAVYVDDPEAVRALLDNVSTGNYVEGDVQRMVYIRPFWPNERPLGFDIPMPEPSPVVPPGTTMTCSPEDGILPLNNH